MARKKGEPAKPRAEKKGETVRWTLDVPAGLDFRLTGLAKLGKSGKAAFALKLLEQGCGNYKADKALKAVIADDQGETEAAA